MWHYITNVALQFIIFHQSGGNMIDTHACRLYAEAWLAEYVK